MLLAEMEMLDIDKIKYFDELPDVLYEFGYPVINWIRIYVNIILGHCKKFPSYVSPVSMIDYRNYSENNHKMKQVHEKFYAKK